jgi:hypothetical protein
VGTAAAMKRQVDWLLVFAILAVLLWGWFLLGA